MYNIGRKYSITDFISIFCIDDEYCSFVLENDDKLPDSWFDYSSWKLISFSTRTYILKISKCLR